MRSHRPQRVANVVRTVVSEAIATKLSDPRIAPLSSVTRVEVSADLEHAKVYVSVMGESSTQRRTLTGLRSASGVVQRMVAQALSIRHCPRLSFHLDESIKKGMETIRLIEETVGPSAGPAQEEHDPCDPSTGDDA